MNISKKLLTLLAIFCVIASASAVCAADVGTDDVYGMADYDDVYDVVEEFDDGGVGSQYQDDGGYAGSQYNDNVENGHPGSPEIDPDYAHQEGAAGEPVNTTGNSTAQAEQNSIAQAEQNVTANSSSSHSMLATGNPILLLLGVTAVIGGAAVIKRK